MNAITSVLLSSVYVSLYVDDFAIYAADSLISQLQTLQPDPLLMVLEVVIMLIKFT